MKSRRIVILGNAGSGKTTLACRLARERRLVHLDLDTIAWAAFGVRRPLSDSIRMMQAFQRAHPGWVIEGCYGRLIEAALPSCTELIFLNPGVEACVRHCRRRPWEPEKYASPEEQHARLETLLAWVRRYETRQDEYGLRYHRALFRRFEGTRQERVEALA